MIDLKQRIPKQLRDQTNAEFEERIKNVSQNDLDNLKTEVPRKIKIISNSQQAYVQELGMHVSILYSMLKLDKIESIEGLQNYQLRIIAAINYFIDDFDIIPDHSLHDGFVDDALVVNQCLKQLPKAQKIKFEQYYSMVSN